MEKELKFRIVLENPTHGVDFGLQKGRGSTYETVQKQRADTSNLIFEFVAKTKADTSNTLIITGHFIQGKPADRFVYIDIGTFAGQKDSQWSRRLKIPLKGITQEMINKALSDSNLVLAASVAGTGKGGGPNCGTVKPFDGWKLTRDQ